MRLQFALLFANILSVTFASSAIAQNKFLAPAIVDNTFPTAVSCSAPIGMVAFASNLGPRDVYLARTGPSSDSDYINTFFEFETQIVLGGDFATTTDAGVAEICHQIEQGDESDALQRELRVAITADLLWWPLDKGYVSAKHVAFVSLDEWERMNGPNPLGYLSFGDRYPLAPIASIEGIDTENARAFQGGGGGNLGVISHCLYGFNTSELVRAFDNWPEGDGTDEPLTLSANQTEFEINNGVWSDCEFDYDVEVDDSELADISREPVPYVANCPARTVQGYEIDASDLPVSYGPMGGLGTNFALLCPAMTIEILQADCDQGNEYSCDKLAEFLAR